MAKRYYLVPVVTEFSDDLGISRRLDLPPGVNHSAVIADNVDWGIAIVATNNHVPLIARAGLIPFPDVSKDIRWQSVHKATRDGFAARLQARGIDTAFIGTADGFREIVRTLARRLDSNFHEDNFDCSE